MIQLTCLLSGRSHGDQARGMGSAPLKHFTGGDLTG